MQVAAFVGLGLTFWGAIFALIKNDRYVDSALLESTAKSNYSTIDRIVNDLNFNPKAYYIPAYPQDASIPQYLNLLKEPVVFISESFSGTPPFEELAAGKFWSDNANGLFVASPGAGLLAQMEKQAKLDFSKASIDDLCAMLPHEICGGFSLSKAMDIKILEGGAALRATGVVYADLYRKEPSFKSVNLLGCPIVSAVASAFAKSTGKTVVIKELTFSPRQNDVVAVYSFI